MARGVSIKIVNWRFKSLYKNFRFLIENPEDLYNEDLLKFNALYKFTLSIENSACDDYITEKLWRPLIVGSIPIYLGSPKVQVYFSLL